MAGEHSKAATAAAAEPKNLGLQRALRILLCIMAARSAADDFTRVLL
jgi:hypothetical protein